MLTSCLTIWNRNLHAISMAHCMVICWCGEPCLCDGIMGDRVAAGRVE